KETGRNGRLTVYRCPQYVPAQPTGKKRMLLDLSFSIAAFFKLLQLLPAKKHDLVITWPRRSSWGCWRCFTKSCAARNSFIIYRTCRSKPRATSA
ncbi:MAG: hypothetical protein ACTHLD_17385, partial [Chitinophaga sp.]